MTLAPLLSANPAVQIHVAAAVAALLLGLVQFAAPKGTLPHRTLGWIWIGLMTVAAVSTAFIHELRLWGPWSPIHLLSIATLAALPVVILHARRHRAGAHRRVVIILFVGALIVPGVLSALPGRIMSKTLFGGERAAAAAVCRL